MTATLDEQIAAARLVAEEHGRPVTTRVGAAALVLRGPLLLLIQRKGSHGAGTWGLPGGWQEFGEPIGYTAVREVAEETGLIVAGGAVVGVTDDWMPEDGVHATTWFIGCRYLEGEPVVMEPDKAEAVRWVALDALDTLPLFGPLKHFLATNPTWRDKVPTLDDPEGLNVPKAAPEEPETFSELVTLIEGVLDKHQRDVWADPEAAGGIDHGDCTNVGEDGWEGHDGPFTRHQARQVAHALRPNLLPLTAQRVVAAFDSYMEPMQDDPDRWPALMAALEALREGMSS